MRMLLVLALIAACGKNNAPPPESTGVPNAKQESGPGKHRPAAMNPADQAKAMYQTVCAMCHGIDGLGDGEAAKTLNPKPRNYTDAAWQASVTDEDIKKTIMLGGTATGKSGAMPAWSTQLKDQPEVLDGLVKIIRGFKKGDAPAAGSATGSATGSAASAGSASK